YHILVSGFAPDKILRLANIAFAGAYEPEVISKWLSICCRRFFSSQFKRSCCPDGPSGTGVSMSPRGGLVMPSDASGVLWQS
ncbi:MAG: NAD(+) synthase, partial [Oscillospiraceae bacterium]|nr:NAD(+) synthase [Oscillospiraceae bacterium]